MLLMLGENSLLGLFLRMEVELPALTHIFTHGPLASHTGVLYVVVI